MDENIAVKNNTKSVVFMLIDALSYSLIPVLAAISAASISGIPYLALSLLLAVITYFVYTKLKHPAIRIPKTREVIITSFLAGLTFAGSHFLLILSISKSSNAYFPTVVFQVYPIFIIIFTIVLGLSKEVLTHKQSTMMGIALVGVIFLYYDDKLVNGLTTYSIVLPILSALLIGLSVALVVRLTHYLEKCGIDDSASPIFSNYISRLQSLFVVTPVFVAYLIAADEKAPSITINNFAIIAVYGVFCLAIGSIFYYRALRLTTKSLSIHMISYLSIVMAIVWLWVIKIDNITAPILIGTAYVLVSNILLNFNLEKNYAYNGSILWILFAGTLVYFSDGWFIESYYDAIIAPLFFFAITLAFLIDRLTKSRELEETHILNFISNLIEEKPEKVETYLRQITQMGCATSLAGLHKHYMQLCGETLGKDNRVLLNKFIISRVKGIKYSEIFVLILTGLLSVAIAIFYRPQGFLYDVFALILTTAVIFNLLYIHDKNKDRSARFLEIRNASGNTYPEVVFDSARSQMTIQKFISSILLGSVIVIFGFVFFLKHGGFY